MHLPVDKCSDGSLVLVADKDIDTIPTKPFLEFCLPVLDTRNCLYHKEEEISLVR